VRNNQNLVKHGIHLHMHSNVPNVQATFPFVQLSRKPQDLLAKGVGHRVCALFPILCRITSIAPGRIPRLKTVHCIVCWPAGPLGRHKAWNGARTRNAGYDVLPSQDFREHTLPNSTFICMKYTYTSISEHSCLPYKTVT